MNMLTLPTFFVGHNLIFKEAGKEASNLAHSLDQAVLSMGTIETVTC